MDVTCNRCNTAYEFEEALVSSRGTTVKCTECGHLFKVLRAASAALPGDNPHWTVRQPDGHCTRLDTLAELPRLIADGKLGRDDELSRTGKVWRRLGDIAELDEHFVAADRRGPSRRLTPAAAEPAASSELTTVRKPLLRPRVEPAAQPEPSPPPAPQRGVRNESRQHAWARLLTSAAIVIAIAVGIFSLPTTGEHFSRAQTEKPADPSERFVAAAERALAAYRLEQFERAQVEYIKALAHRERDADLLRALSHVFALWAQELRTQRTLNGHSPGRAAAPVLEAQELQAQALAQQAKRYAELAVQGISGNPAAWVAQSDALRLSGDLKGARAALERAHDASSAEALRVSALLQLGEHPDGDPRAATELAARAVSADPKRLATRFLLARLLLSQGELAGVREQLHAISAIDREHPEAARLQTLLAEREAGAAQAAAEPESTKGKALSEADSFIERGRSLLEAGQTAGAKRMFDHALTLQPDSLAAHAGLGQVALARGRPVQAIDHLVAAALGGDGDSLIALADLYRRLGRQREALAAYQSYLQQNPQGPQLELAKAQIERLGEQFASARKP